MTDRFVVRAVVLGLFALGLAFAGGIIYLASTGGDHGVLDNLAAVVVGALSGVLSRTNTEPQQVSVINPVGDPVPTADVPAATTRRKRSSGHIDLGGVLAVAVIALIVVVILAAIGKV